MTEAGVVFSSQRCLLLLPPTDVDLEPKIVSTLDAAASHRLNKPGLTIEFDIANAASHMSYAQLRINLWQPNAFGTLSREEMLYQIHYKDMANPKRVALQGEGVDAKRISDLDDNRKDEVKRAFNLSDDVSRDELWYVEIDHPIEACGNNLFTYKRYSDEVSQDFERVREYLFNSEQNAEHPICVVVRHLELDQHVDQLKLNWQYEWTHPWKLNWLKKIGKANIMFYRPNEIRAPEDRARYTVPYKHRANYLTADEAQILTGVGLRQEQEAVQSEAAQSFPCTVRIVEMPKGRNKDGLVVQFAMFAQSHDSKGWPVFAKEGQVCHIRLDTTSEATSRDLVGKVAASPSIASITDKTIVCTRSYNKEMRQWLPLKLDGSDPQIHDIQHYETVMAGRESVQKMPGVEAIVNFVVPDQQFERVKKAAADIDRDPRDVKLHHKMTGNNLWRGSPHNFFNKSAFQIAEGVDFDAHIKEWFADCNADQRKLIKLLGEMPLETALLMGTAGSGKSRVLFKLAMFLMTTLAHDGSKNLALHVYPDNANADGQSRAVYEALSKYRKDHGQAPPVVVRLHSTNAEKQIFLRDAEASRPSDPERKDVGDYFDDNEDFYLTMGMVAYVLRRTDDQRIKRRWAFVNDPRAVNIDLAVATYMCEFIDANGEDSPYYIPGRPYTFALRDHLFRYARGLFFLDWQKKDFADLRRRCRNDVLMNADGVFTTPSQLLNPSYYRPMRHRTAVYGIFDESSKIAYLDYFAIQAAFRGKIRNNLLAGDLGQGKIQTQTTPQTNCLHDRYAVSILQFKYDVGFSYVYLSVQHRTVKEISDLWRDILYRPLGVDLCAHPAVEQHHEAQEALRASKLIFTQLKSPSRAVLVDIDQTKTYRLPGGGSKINEKLILGCIEIKDALIVIGKLEREKIIILSPYRANVAAAKRVEESTKPKLGTSTDVPIVDNETFMKYQGQQQYYVIVNLVMTNVAGFLNDITYLLPGLTRGRYLLVVVADVRGMQKGRNYHGSLPERVIDWFLLQGLVHRWTLSEPTQDAKDALPSAGEASERGIKQRVVDKKYGRGCRVCSEETHLAADCPNKDDPKYIYCDRCTERGHRRAQCQLSWCNKCKVAGDHETANCPQAGRRKGCKNCGSFEHMVRYCPVEFIG